MIIQVSGEKNSLGKIVEVNQEMCTQLIYQKKDLLGNRIRKMLPSMIAEHHDDWILKSYETQQFKKLNLLSHGFFKDGEGFFVPVALALKVIPNLKEGLNFLGVLQINHKMTWLTKNSKEISDAKENLCVFICEANGKIVGVNKETSIEFKITPEYVDSNKEVTIQEIFPILHDPKIAEAANSNEGITAEINLLQIQQLNLDSEFSEENAVAAAKEM